MNVRTVWSCGVDDEYLSGNPRWAVFFFLWTLGLFLLLKDTGVAASSMPIRSHQLPVFVPLEEIPDVSNEADLADNLMQHLRSQSTVFNGRWQPRVPVVVREPLPPKATMIAVDAEGSPKKLIKKVTKDLSEGTPAVARKVIKSLSSNGSEQTDNQVATASSELRKMSARVSIEDGDYQAAYHILMKNLPEVTVDTEFYALLGPVLLQTRRYNQAADVYASLLSLDRQNPRWWAGYALSLENLGAHAAMDFAYTELHRVAGIDSPLKQLASQKIKFYS